MSFDAKIDALIAATNAQTEALDRNTAALLAVNEGRAEALAAINTAGDTKKTTRSSKKDEPKVVDYTGEAGLKKFKELAGGWMAADGDETESEQRQGIFARALKKFGAAKLGELPEDKRGTVAGWITTLAAGENVDELAEEEKKGGLLD